MKKLVNKQAGQMQTILDAYLESMLWSSIDLDTPEYEGSPNNKMLDATYSLLDIADSTIESAKKDINSFIEQAGDLLNDEQLRNNPAEIGHWFWLSRNGHGAGFFDMKDSEKGKKIHEIAKTFKGIDPYVGNDDKVHAEAYEPKEAAKKKPVEDFVEEDTLVREEINKGKMTEEQEHQLDIDCWELKDAVDRHGQFMTYQISHNDKGETIVKFEGDGNYWDEMDEIIEKHSAKPVKINSLVTWKDEDGKEKGGWVISINKDMATVQSADYETPQKVPVKKLTVEKSDEGPELPKQPKDKEKKSPVVDPKELKEVVDSFEGVDLDANKKASMPKEFEPLVKDLEEAKGEDDLEADVERKYPADLVSRYRKWQRYEFGEMARGKKAYQSDQKDLTKALENVAWTIPEELKKFLSEFAGKDIKPVQHNMKYQEIYDVLEDYNYHTLNTVLEFVKENSLSSATKEADEWMKGDEKNQKFFEEQDKEAGKNTKKDLRFADYFMQKFFEDMVAKEHMTPDEAEQETIRRFKEYDVDVHSEEWEEKEKEPWLKSKGLPSKKKAGKNWKGKLQDNYDGDIEQFKKYNETYGIAERLGYKSADEAWSVNPTIEVGTDPKDLRVIESQGKGVEAFIKQAESLGIKVNDCRKEGHALDKFFKANWKANLDLTFIPDNMRRGDIAKVSKMVIEKISKLQAKSDIPTKVGLAKIKNYFKVSEKLDEFNASLDLTFDWGDANGVEIKT